MKNVQFGRETNNLLFYIKIKIFSIPVKVVIEKNYLRNDLKITD